ncbi:MAG: hypothetical protein HOJ48_09960 [Desulfobacula sp.]|jgi:hypothetical protein|nr:hypothetical protein [Desulfobacula sp.]
MKRFVLLLTLLLLPALAFGQQKDGTKMDKIRSKKGVTIRFIDYKLPVVESRFAPLKLTVKVFEAGDESQLFYEVYVNAADIKDTNVAWIAEEDLSDMINALQSLKQTAIKDAQSNPDFLENRFVTEDGFSVGYYVSEGQPSWFISFDKIGKGSDAFFDHVAIIEDMFKQAKDKMDSLH